MTVVRMPSKNHAARVDTSRLCCDQRCSQGRDCPLVDRRAPIDMPAPTKAERAIEAVCWIAAVAMLTALFRACMEAPL